MDEEMWLTTVEPSELLEFLGRRACSPRKQRLYEVACCRRIWKSLPDERSCRVVEIAELYADGLVDHDQLVAAWYEAREVELSWHDMEFTPAQDRAAIAACDSARDTGSRATSYPLFEATRVLSFEDRNQRDEGELQSQVNLLRCIFGNPFRPQKLDPAWITSRMVSFAKGIYDERAFDRMPILGDMLEEAACESPDVLDHCREHDEHARGCWVVDAILGKS